MLIETLVESPRHTGSVYRASGWFHIVNYPDTRALRPEKQYDRPRKDIWLRPLRKDWKRTLNR